MVVWQQRQLVQSSSKLRGRFRHRRAGGGPMTGLAPPGDGFCNEPSLDIMLCEDLGLVLHHLGGMSRERFGDPGMELLPCAAQKSAVGSLLHQRVLEQVLGRRRCSALKDQASADESLKRLFNASFKEFSDRCC